MSMIVQLRGHDELVEWLRSLPPLVQKLVHYKMQALASSISARIKEKLSGTLLQVKSGALRNSIVGRTYEGKNSVTMSIGSRGNIPYAAILEYGGTTKAHTISPVKANVLRFMSKEGVIRYAKSVQHPGSRIPEFAYVRTTIDEMMGEVNAEIWDAAQEALRQ